MPDAAARSIKHGEAIAVLQSQMDYVQTQIADMKTIVDSLNVKMSGVTATVNTIESLIRRNGTCNGNGNGETRHSPYVNWGVPVISVFSIIQMLEQVKHILF